MAFARREGVRRRGVRLRLVVGRRVSRRAPGDDRRPGHGHARGYLPAVHLLVPRALRLDRVRHRGRFHHRRHRSRPRSRRVGAHESRRNRAHPYSRMERSHATRGCSNRVFTTAVPDGHGTADAWFHILFPPTAPAVPVPRDRRPAEHERRREQHRDHDGPARQAGDARDARGRPRGAGDKPAADETREGHHMPRGFTHGRLGPAPRRGAPRRRDFGDDVREGPSRGGRVRRHDPERRDATNVARAAVRHLHEPVRHTWRARDAAPGLEDRAADVAPERLRGRGELHARRRAPGGFPGGPVQVLQLAHVQVRGAAGAERDPAGHSGLRGRRHPPAQGQERAQWAVQHVGRVRRTDLRRDAQAVQRGGVHRHRAPGDGGGGGARARVRFVPGHAHKDPAGGPADLRGPAPLAAVLDGHGARVRRVPGGSGEAHEGPPGHRGEPREARLDQLQAQARAAGVRLAPGVAAVPARFQARLKDITSQRLPGSSIIFLNKVPDEAFAKLMAAVGASKKAPARTTSPAASRSSTSSATPRRLAF